VASSNHIPRNRHGKITWVDITVPAVIHTGVSGKSGTPHSHGPNAHASRESPERFTGISDRMELTALLALTMIENK